MEYLNNYNHWDADEALEEYEWDFSVEALY